MCIIERINAKCVLNVESPFSTGLQVYR